MKEIRRKTLKIATAPQMRLFEANEETAQEERGTRQGGVRFTDPDPRQIYLGGRRLDEYLREAGQSRALKLRTVLRALDWSGFEASYVEEGRRPYAPAAMLSLVLDGLMHGVCSLRGLEVRARMDLGCMWLSGGISPDHSSLGRFIVRHQELLSEEFFETLTAKVLQRCGGGVEEVALDGTVVQAVASLAKMLKLEAAREALKRAQEAAAARAEDAQVLEELARAQSVAQVAEERAAARKDKGRDAESTRVSPSEPEAVLQPLKTGGSRPSYKPVILANAQRLIVGQAVEPSSETQPVAGLLEQAERIGHKAAAAPPAAEPAAAAPPAAEPAAAAPPAAESRLRCLLADAGFFTDELIRCTDGRNIEFLCPQGSVQDSKSWDKGSEKFFAKSLFVYDPQSDSFLCPAAETLQPSRHYAGSARSKPYVRYSNAVACASCPLRAKCTSSPSGRGILRYPGDARKDQLRDRMKQPQVRTRYRKRQAWVEPVFSSLKLSQGLRRFLRRGLKAVRLEFALHAMAHNLSRLLALSAAASAALASALCGLLGALLASKRRSQPLQAPFAPAPPICLHVAPCHYLVA